MQPYLFNGSHKIKLVIKDVDQTLDEVVRKGIEKEVALLMNSMTEISYIDVENTSRLVKKLKHRKHLVSIDDYGVYPYRQYRSKYFVIEPVWLSIHLEGRIFNETKVIEGDKKMHPQLACYQIFKK